MTPQKPPYPLETYKYHNLQVEVILETPSRKKEGSFFPRVQCSMNELHLHIDGSIRHRTLKEWCPDIEQDFGFRQGMNLSDCLACFATTVGALNSYARIERTVREICEDQDILDIERTELRFAPHIHGLDSRETIRAAVRGLDVNTNLILCALYGDCPSIIEGFIDIAKHEPRIVGIDIAGAPLQEHRYGLQDYAGVFQEAARAKLGRTAHLGEGRPPEEIVAGIELLDLNRVGHACSLLASDRAVGLVLERDVVIEACPTSNVHVGIYTDVGQHPIKDWIDAGVLVSVCADNTLMSHTNVREEINLLSLSPDEQAWVELSSKRGLFDRSV